MGARAVVEGRRAEGIVSVRLDFVAARVEEMSDASFVVLAVVERLPAVHPGFGAHQDFVDSFPIHVLCPIVRRLNLYSKIGFSPS